MVKKKTNEEATTVEIPALETRVVNIEIVGDSDLICHSWSDKAKKEMLNKQMKKAEKGKDPKDPERDYRESLYWLNADGHRIPAGSGDPNDHKYFGFPSAAFRLAAVRGCKNVKIAMTDGRAAFYVMDEFVLIKHKGIDKREDMVRLQKKTADIRYRAAFRDWSATLKVRYNVNCLTVEQIVNLFEQAGFGVGVGEWRPERNGSFGTFHVKKEK